MRPYSRGFLRFHAVFAMLLGLGMAGLATVGHVHGAGPLAVLGDNPLAYMGLLQAYLIFAVAGLSMWAASGRTPSLWPWHLCGLLAHLPAFVLTLHFWSWMTAQGVPTGAVFLHGAFILAEGLFVSSYTLGPRKAA
ncbi:MAG: hypothetical protein AAFU80_21655 [Pseudomonadota bacterium]